MSDSENKPENKSGMEILQVVKTVSNEKGIEREVIFDALEVALATATRTKLGSSTDVRIAINRETGDYETFRRWLVMEDDDPEFQSPDGQILLSAAKRLIEGSRNEAESETETDSEPGHRLVAVSDGKEEPEIGDYIEEPIDSVDIARIAAHTAKQVIVQRVRDAERAQVADAYEEKVGGLLTGIVKRKEHSGTYLDLGGNAEGFIPREEIIEHENIRGGDRLRAYLREVRRDTRGPQLILSRTAPEFLIMLFRLEVPEIDQGIIEIIDAVRDPGIRAKIAVRTNDSRVDPVGACVGMRGARVQAVSNELSGERIDIITWHENPAQYVINAMSLPAVDEIVQDDENNVMDIAVEEGRMSQAVGSNGQNVRLASRLTGWTLNVLTAQELREKTEKEQRELEENFQEELDVDEYIAAILVENGYRQVHELAYAADEELTDIDEFNEQVAFELRERARESVESRTENTDIMNVTGMDIDLALQFAIHGITTRRQLAELALDELPEIEGLGDERAGELIMSARENLVLKAATEANDGGKTPKG